MLNAIAERDLGVYHYLTASLLGGLADLGLLNQGSANLVGRRTGERLAEFFKTADLELSATCTENLATVMELIGVASRFDIMEENGGIVVYIPTGLCRYCPKGVGGAEITGTACPLPGMLEALLNSCSSARWRVDLHDGRPLVKEDNNCKIRYIPA